MQAIKGIPGWQLASFGIFGMLSIAMVLTAWHTETYALLLAPAIAAIAIWTIRDFQSVFYLLLFTLPLSIEFNITPSLGTDLPSEPLIIGLLAAFLLYSARNLQELNVLFLRTSIICGLLIHYCWILLASVVSETPLISFKFLLAKTWYIGVFVFLGAWILHDKERIIKAFWLIYFPLTAMIIQTLIRHGMRGFVFEDINDPVMPFFRNHVNYAAMITAFLPFLWLAKNQYSEASWTRRLLLASIPLYLAGIFFSYTRACLLATAALIPFIFLLRHRALRYVLMVGLVITTTVLGILSSGNQYLRFAPEFKKTVYHSELDDHMSSTFEGQDVSSMERIYRWVAAMRMWPEHPWFGYGPNSFTSFYKKHTVYSFETYVSDNEEKSTVHNYFLLILVEQGLIGLLIFLGLSLLIFVRGEALFFYETDPWKRSLYLAIMCSFAVIYINLLLSDLLETDKIGSLYFLLLGLLGRAEMEKSLKKT